MYCAMIERANTEKALNLKKRLLLFSKWYRQTKVKRWKKMVIKYYSSVSSRSKEVPDPFSTNKTRSLHSFFFIHRFIFYFPDFKQPTKCTVMKKKLACLDLLNDNGGLCMFCWCWNLFAFRRNCNLQAVVASKMNKI